MAYIISHLRTNGKLEGNRCFQGHFRIIMNEKDLGSHLKRRRVKLEAPYPDVA